MSTPVKVTSGKDVQEFVAAKPKPMDPEHGKAENIEPSKEAIEAHNARMAELDAAFEKRKKEVAEEEARMIAASKQRAAQADQDLKEAFEQKAKKLEDHPTNSRGAPIPVDESAVRPVRHISEIGDDYNGKPDTIPGHADDSDEF